MVSRTYFVVSRVLRHPNSLFRNRFVTVAPNTTWAANKRQAVLSCRFFSLKCFMHAYQLAADRAG